VSALAFADIVERLRAVFPAATLPAIETKTSDNGQPWLLVPANDIVRVATVLRDDPVLGFAALCDLTGWDLLKYAANPPSTDIAIVYYLHSLIHRHHLTLKVLAPRDTGTVPSVSSVWPVANYFEREVFDLLGVHFAGHPNLKRIMMPDDWIGSPLRKDYIYPASYNGIAHLRDGQKFEDAPTRGDAAAPAQAAKP